VPVPLFAYSTSMIRHLQYIIAIAMLVSVAACRKSDGLQRVEVQGNVTYQGAPAEHGLITFRPATGSSGPAAGTGIINGKYFIPAEKGPVAGPHEVEIKILEHGGDAAKPAQSGLATRGQLQMKTFSQHVEISSGANRLAFSLPFTSADDHK
jgi:hypothetical protein